MISKANSYLYETSKTNLKPEKNHLVTLAVRMVWGTHPWVSFKTLDPMVIKWTDNRERSGYLRICQQYNSNTHYLLILYTAPSLNDEIYNIPSGPISRSVGTPNPSPKIVFWSSGSELATFSAKVPFNCSPFLSELVQNDRFCQIDSLRQTYHSCKQNQICHCWEIKVQ